MRACLFCVHITVNQISNEYIKCVHYLRLFCCSSCHGSELKKAIQADILYDLQSLLSIFNILLF